MDTPETRFTINQIEPGQPISLWKPRLADWRRRRHLSYSLDFDTRVHSLEEPGDGWGEEAIRLHNENRNRTRAALAAQFGARDIDRKVADFVAIKTKPFSVLAYHNAFFEQARNAFVAGAYYPALVGACALGERILNHLILDLRSFYSSKPEYRRVAKKESFDNWQIPIRTLEDWGVLMPAAALEFRALMPLRHRSIHFNPGTYTTLREDALAAILHMREIIDQQFTSFGDRPWFIKGTRGLIFIKQEWESNPFVATYYLPTSPFVGPYLSISFAQGLQFHDHSDYGDGAWTDEEFAAVYEARKPEQLAPS